MPARSYTLFSTASLPSTATTDVIQPFHASLASLCPTPNQHNLHNFTVVQRNLNNTTVRILTFDSFNSIPDQHEPQPSLGSRKGVGEPMDQGERVSRFTTCLLMSTLKRGANSLQEANGQGQGRKEAAGS